jgi:hypothetical protein
MRKYFQVNEKGIWDIFRTNTYSDNLLEDIFLDFSKVTKVSIVGRSILINGEFNKYSYGEDGINNNNRYGAQKYEMKQLFTYINLVKETDLISLRKALIHAAKLNGATLISDDLFKN